MGCVIDLRAASESACPLAGDLRSAADAARDLIEAVSELTVDGQGYDIAVSVLPDLSHRVWVELTPELAHLLAMTISDE